MEESESQSYQSDGDICVKLCLLVLDDDVVEVDDIGADEHRQRGRHLETVLHVLLCYLLYLLQVVAVLDLLLHTVCETQQRYNLLAVGTAGHLRHDVVSQVAGQTAEDWVFGEVNELVCTFIISYVYLEQTVL